MWFGMVGMPASTSPSRSMTVVISRSSTCAQSSIRGERKRQPAASRQKICIFGGQLQTPPIEGLALRIPIDVERVAAFVVEIDPHSRLAGDLARAGLGGGVERLERYLRLLGAEGGLAASLPAEIGEPRPAAGRDGGFDDPHPDAGLADARGGGVRATVLVGGSPQEGLRHPL